MVPDQDISHLKALRRQLGFEETPELRRIRNEIIDAIRAGRAGPIHDAWRKYLDAARPQVDFKDAHRASRARVACTIAQALIYLDTGDAVGYLTQMMTAELIARTSGWTGIQEVLLGEMTLRGSLAEYRQAEGNHQENLGNTQAALKFYEEAISQYLSDEDMPGLDDYTRGLICLRIAECNSSLLELSARNPQQLRQYVFESLADAVNYLRGTADQARALGVIEDLRGEAWWQILEGASE